MNVIDIGSTVLDRCLPTPRRVRGGVEQALPDPVIGGGRAVVRGALDIAGRLVDIPEDLSQRVKAAALLQDTELSTDRARQAYLDLAGRGEATVNTIRVNPQLARVLNGLHTASTRVDQGVQDIADQLHDSTEELLGWASVTASATARWFVWLTPSRTRALLRLISRRPTPGDLSPAPTPRNQP